MTLTEIASSLGSTKSAVNDVLRRGLKKLRRLDLTGFVEAVRMKRAWLDYYYPNRPWNDIDAGV